MKNCIALLVLVLVFAGCSFSKKDDVPEDKLAAISSSKYDALKNAVMNETPEQVSIFLSKIDIDLSDDQVNEIFDIVVNRGNADVYTLLERREVFSSLMHSGEFIFRQRAMNLDIRGALIIQLSSSMADITSFKLKACSEVLSTVFFLRWAQARMLEQDAVSIAGILADKKCRNVDSKLLSYIFRNELAFLYLNSSSSLYLMAELAIIHEVSRKSYLSGRFAWGHLMISPLLVLANLPESIVNREQLAAIMGRMHVALEASFDIAYYVVARSGSYRVGRFSNKVELVSLEDALISELVQQNADFVFDRNIPVDQDIKLP
nr:hypothetical protein HAGR004_06860 [Bdellovibrio sp. HAGR004]